jgi:hypothetical protein
LFQTLASSLDGNNIFNSDELSLTTSVRDYWTSLIINGQPNDNAGLVWSQYSSATDQAIVLNINISVDTFTDVYPNYDILSAALVEVFGEYLDFNATCTVGNKGFIISSTISVGLTNIKHDDSPEHISVL